MGIGTPISQSNPQPMAPVWFITIFDKRFIVPPETCNFVNPHLGRLNSRNLGAPL
jgi:hypothetical protein